MPVAESKSKIDVEWMYVADLARLFGVHPASILRWERSSKIPRATRIGGTGRPRWRRDVVERFIEGR